MEQVQEMFNYTAVEEGRNEANVVGVCNMATLGAASTLDELSTQIMSRKYGTAD